MNRAATKRKRGREAKPGRHTCKIFWTDHIPGRPAFTMQTKDFHEKNARKLSQQLNHYKSLVAGTKDTAGGENWTGRITWAAIYRDGTDKLAEFKDWDRDGLPYWKEYEAQQSDA